tara:strand:- start:2058 stop:2654 length:597 start_codon:yes stop_codon:yes gene_type:complete
MSELKLLSNNILKNELLHIKESVFAIIEPQSQESKRVYERYRNSIKEDEIHNHNVSNLTIGEIQKYDIKEKYIPEFSEYILRQLTTSGYNNNRYDQLLLNNKNELVEYQYEPGFHKLVTDLESICNTSRNIANYISNNDYQSAKKTLEFLMGQYSSYFPKYENPIEAKPGIFGFSIDLFKVVSLLKSVPAIKKILKKT